MFCGYEAVFGAFAKYSNEGSDRDSECNLPQNPLTQHGLVLRQRARRARAGRTQRSRPPWTFPPDDARRQAFTPRHGRTGTERPDAAGPVPAQGDAGRGHRGGGEPQRGLGCVCPLDWTSREPRVILRRLPVSDALLTECPRDTHPIAVDGLDAGCLGLTPWNDALTSAGLWLNAKSNADGVEGCMEGS